MSLCESPFLPESLVTGVDGCRGGWIAFSHQTGFSFHTSFSALVASQRGKLFVDIPMGLTQQSPRRLEQLARTRLPGKASSLFNVPCRDAVYAETYENACDINAAAWGKKLSLQSWYICPKIREADLALRADSSLSDRVYESHPELAFYLIGGELLPKRQPDGIRQRLEVLEGHLPNAEAYFNEALQTWPRRDVARDDLLDAMVLSLLGKLPTQTLTDADQLADEAGIPIRMVIPAAI